MSQDADTVRADMRARWRKGASGWARRAEDIRRFGMPVSARMLEHLGLQPGQTVLELAAGPGDTGFMAAELVRPGGRLISSDGAQEMVEVARERAAAQGIDNVEFKVLELEWIDLETASVDAVLCRWGLMFAPDPGAALQEMRRVLRPGGRVALAVWDSPDRNPWATIATRALVELGHVPPPDPAAPGMFVLGDAERLRMLLQGAGFGEARVEPVEVERDWPGAEEYVAETLELSVPFAETRERLDDQQWDRVTARIGELASGFADDQGRLQMTGRALVATATA
jgi:ubiquinone/menaquinone biosynthesis C-methylase UbiE